MAEDKTNRTIYRYKTKLMKHHEVESSNIKSVGHDVLKQTMEITFHNGSTYSYYPITEWGYKTLMNTSSIGGYFYKNIRNNKDITTEKIDNEKPR